MVPTPFELSTRLGLWLHSKNPTKFGTPKMLLKSAIVTFIGALLVILGMANVTEWSTVEWKSSSTETSSLIMDLNGRTMKVGTAADDEKTWSKCLDEDTDNTNMICQSCSKHGTAMIGCGSVAVIIAVLLGINLIRDSGAAKRGEYKFDHEGRMFDTPVFGCVATALVLFGCFFYDFNCPVLAANIINNGNAVAEATVAHGSAFYLCKFGAFIILLGTGGLTMQTNRVAATLAKQAQSADVKKSEV